MFSHFFWRVYLYWFALKSVQYHGDHVTVWHGHEVLPLKSLLCWNHRLTNGNSVGPFLSHLRGSSGSTWLCPTRHSSWHKLVSQCVLHCRKKCPCPPSDPRGWLAEVTVDHAGWAGRRTPRRQRVAQRAWPRRTTTAQPEDVSLRHFK